MPSVPMENAVYSWTMSGIASIGAISAVSNSQVINAIHAGPRGILTDGGISAGSTPAAAKTFAAGSTSTAMTIRMSSRNNAALLARSSGDARLRSVSAASDRANASNAARRQD